MNDWVASVMPTLVLVLTVAAVSRLMGDTTTALWRKFGKPAVNATFLHEVRADIAALKTDIADIKHVVMPNDGSSIIDTVTRIDRKLTDHMEAEELSIATVYENLAEHARDLDVIRRGVRSHLVTHGEPSPEGV